MNLPPVSQSRAVAASRLGSLVPPGLEEEPFGERFREGNIRKSFYLFSSVPLISSSCSSSDSSVVHPCEGKWAFSRQHENCLSSDWDRGRSVKGGEGQATDTEENRLLFFSLPLCFSRSIRGDFWGLFLSLFCGILLHCFFSCLCFRVILWRHWNVVALQMAGAKW